MKNRIIFITALLGLLWASAAGAQTPAAGQTPPQPAKPPAESTAQAGAQTPAAPPPIPDRPAYVRRFSAGGRLSIMTLNSMESGTAEMTNPSIPAQYKWSSEAKSNRVGGGLSMQVALTERTAVNVDLLYHKTGYKRNTEMRIGIDNPSTSQDERVVVNLEEQTRMSYWELPILGRFYNIGRHEEGWRYFYQGGVAFRKAGNAVSFISTDNKCCSENGGRPAHQYTIGLVAGAGIQIYDNFGIKIIPEVRYTWWTSRMIDARPARSAVHQLEAIIGITF